MVDPTANHAWSVSVRARASTCSACSLRTPQGNWFGAASLSSTPISPLRHAESWGNRRAEQELEVVVADAGLTDSYVGAVPADLVIVCGVFGNISDRDVEATVRAMPSLCSQGGAVIWTRHRHEPDLTPAIRRWFADAGFAEQAFTSPGIDSFAVGVHRLNGPGVTLSAGRQLFTFTH